MSEKKVNYLADAWLILLLALLFGCALAGVQAGLQPIINQNKLNETLGKVPELVPGAVSAEKAMVGEIMAYKGLDADGNVAGWVIPAKGQGFADKIELLLGLDANAGKITGMYVLDQKETPGLGDKIKSDLAWGQKYVGKSAARTIGLTKAAPTGNEIQAITGATISSESVTKIVNKYAADFRGALQGVK
ncbi:FMN-binding protein [Verrucomicrobiota bacterium]